MDHRPEGRLLDVSQGATTSDLELINIPKGIYFGRSSQIYRESAKMYLTEKS
jgi:hypothetical protein